MVFGVGVGRVLTGATFACDVAIPEAFPPFEIAVVPESVFEDGALLVELPEVMTTISASRLGPAPLPVTRCSLESWHSNYAEEASHR